MPERKGSRFDCTCSSAGVKMKHCHEHRHENWRAVLTTVTHGPVKDWKCASSLVSCSRIQLCRSATPQASKLYYFRLWTACDAQWMGTAIYQAGTRGGDGIFANFLESTLRSIQRLHKAPQRARRHLTLVTDKIWQLWMSTCQKNGNQTGVCKRAAVSAYAARAKS